MVSLGPSPPFASVLGFRSRIWAFLLFWRIAQALTPIIPYFSHQRGFAEACSLNPEGRDYLAG